jgi:hypothetical protein
LGLPSNRTICRLPILLPGVKCYYDASILPDKANTNPRKAGLGIFILAGLGIFILDPMHHCKFFIKAQVDQMASALMAEAAGFALAPSIISLLHISEASFLWMQVALRRSARHASARATSSLAGIRGSSRSAASFCGLCGSAA